MGSFYSSNAFRYGNTGNLSKAARWRISEDERRAEAHAENERRTWGTYATYNEYHNIAPTHPFIQTRRRSLATEYPTIAAHQHEYNSTELHCYDRAELEWTCDSGHTWISSTYALTQADHNTVCPLCRQDTAYHSANSLATRHPWAAERAIDWNPTAIPSNSNLTLNWACVKGHQRTAALQTILFAGHYTCAECDRVTALLTDNLSLTNPDLAAEAKGWNATKYNNRAYQHKQWQCATCSHTWTAGIAERARGENPCLICHPRGRINPAAKRYFYIHEIKNTQTGNIVAYKFGIAFDVLQRVNTQQRSAVNHLEIRNVFKVRATSASVVTLETRIKETLRHQNRIPQGLTRAELPDGYTETVPANRIELEELVALVHRLKPWTPKASANSATVIK